jgi:hypothetical protein
VEHRDAYVEEILSDDEPESDSDGIVVRRSRAPQSHLESAALKIRRAKRQGNSNVTLTHGEIDALVRTSSMRDPRKAEVERRRVSLPTYSQRDPYLDPERYREPDVDPYEPEVDPYEREPEPERYEREPERERRRDRDRDYDRERRRERRDRRSLEPSSQSTSPQRSREPRAAWSRRRRPTLDRAPASSTLVSRRPVRSSYVEAPTSTPTSRRQSRRSTRGDERDRLTPPTPEDERLIDRRLR